MTINAGTAGEVSFAKDWQIKGVNVTEGWDAGTGKELDWCKF
jgi:hypothetical protein